MSRLSGSSYHCVANGSWCQILAKANDIHLLNLLRSGLLDLAPKAAALKLPLLLSVNCQVPKDLYEISGPIYWSPVVKSVLICLEYTMKMLFM